VLSLTGEKMKERALRTVRNLSCVLADACDVWTGPGQDGHVDELGLEVSEHHVVLALVVPLARLGLALDR